MYQTDFCGKSDFSEQWTIAGILPLWSEGSVMFCKAKGNIALVVRLPLVELQGLVSGWEICWDEELLQGQNLACSPQTCNRIVEISLGL